MTPAISNTPKLAPKSFDVDAVKFLASRGGPFLTAIIPDRHPGAPEGSRRSIIQSLVKNAQEQLAASPFADRALELVAPLEALARDPDVAAGGAGFAIFLSPERGVFYRAPGHTEKIVLSSHPFLTPFFAEASVPNDFFILGLSTKHLRLFHYANGECTEVDLPEGVPTSLEEAGKRSDLNLENRSSIGSNAGSMHSMRFGTMSDRESAGDHLRHFFGLADHGLKPLLAGKPLLLMGVHEEIHAYERAAKYGHLLGSGIDGSPDVLSVAQAAALAREAAKADYERQADAVLAEFREMKERVRTLKDPLAILRAAAQGRVHRLCVRKDTQLFVAAKEAGVPKQDLVNAAAVETLRTGGEVFELGQDRMAEAEPLAAILRY